MLAMGVRRFYLRSQAGCAGRRVEIDAADKERLRRPIRCLPGQRSLPASLRGENRCVLLRHPRPSRAFAGRYPCASAGTPAPPAPSGGYPYASAGDPRPGRASSRGIPIRFCRRPPPHPRLRRDTCALLPASPAPAAPAALLPRPPGGRGSACDIRGAAVSGVELVGNRIRGGAGGKQYPGCSRRADVPGSTPGSPHAVDRVDIATRGGADGEGELVPPPLSPTLQPSYFSPAPPPAPSQKDTTRFCRPPPPAPISLPGR